MVEDGGETGFVKVGVADDPQKRLRQMQTGNPRTLSFNGLSEPIDRGVADKAENVTHRWLGDWCHRNGKLELVGEWFECAPDFAAEYVGLAIRHVTNPMQGGPFSPSGAAKLPPHRAKSRAAYQANVTRRTT